MSSASATLVAPVCRHCSVPSVAWLNVSAEPTAHSWFFRCHTCGHVWSALKRSDEPVLQSRQTRVHGTGLMAHAGGCAAQVVNVSLTGALLLLPAELSVGSDVPCCLQSSTEFVPLRGKVVRVTRETDAAPASEPATRWQIAIAFVGLSAHLRASIARLVRSCRA